tara:strand:+ start:50 stop:286 length:237 start_codon:yes stop_codon:yes gene_type:complete
MFIPVRRIIISLLFNSSLFLMLFIGIQNSTNKTKLNFFSNETVELPISFIIGISFISGSIAGSFIRVDNIFSDKFKGK